MSEKRLDPDNRVAYTWEDGPLPRIVKWEEGVSLKWLKLQRLQYFDAKGKLRLWEVCVRTTQQPGAKADAVGILSIIEEPGKEREIILVKQWRPPLGSFTIEMPAGLIDKGETPEEAALRELKEETGFVGTIDRGSYREQPIPLSPGMINEQIMLVPVKVDMSTKENKNPVQKLEETESIQVLRVPLCDLMKRLQELQDEGCSIFSAVYFFAMGLELPKTQRSLVGHADGLQTQHQSLMLLTMGAVIGAGVVYLFRRRK